MQDGNKQELEMVKDAWMVMEKITEEVLQQLLTALHVDHGTN